MNKTASLHVDALVAELGSTTTLVSAFHGLADAPRFLGQGMAPTTAHVGDVTLGLRAAVADLKAVLMVGELTWGRMYAASSAAGGLSMSVHGLVYEMTARAAHLAALGAGAVVRQVTAGKLGAHELDALRALKPNLMMLAGGTDYGDRDTAVYNARALAGLRLGIPTLYAGNTAASDEVASVFAAAGQPLRVIDNVYPSLDELNIEPARRAIQELFEEHIVSAPGMAHVRDLVDGAILPTPGAVMEAVRLLHPELGDLLAVDIGGATTDVHSAADMSEEVARIQDQPEPFFKRTVEGDLGTYVNADIVAGLVGHAQLDRELNLDSQQLLRDWPPIPRDDQQARLTARLMLAAGSQAIARHAGRLRRVHLPEGSRLYARGKDLSQAGCLLATGGALTRLPGREEVLRHLRDLNKTGMMLYPPPGHLRLLVDEMYLMAVLGVLSREHPEAALSLLKDSLREVADG
ncbi:MAG: DNA mismatch repair protein MutL [Clostridiales bacterium]|nr:DNA mismatch repair protein MutL [Clostridiales bacterium]